LSDNNLNLLIHNNTIANKAKPSNKIYYNNANIKLNGSGQNYPAQINVNNLNSKKLSYLNTDGDKSVKYNYFHSINKNNI